MSSTRQRLTWIFILGLSLCLGTGYAKGPKELREGQAPEKAAVNLDKAFKDLPVSRVSEIKKGKRVERSTGKRARRPASPGGEECPATHKATAYKIELIRTPRKEEVSVVIDGKIRKTTIYATNFEWGLIAEGEPVTAEGKKVSCQLEMSSLIETSDAWPDGVEAKQIVEHSPAFRDLQEAMNVYQDLRAQESDKVFVALKKLISPKDALAMVWKSIPAGTFQMGSPAAEVGWSNDETQHEVTLTKGFEMMSTEVTQKQWFDVMKKNPSYFARRHYCDDYVEEEGIGLCPNHPVEQVSWDDVQTFIAKFNEQRKDDGYTYRLPTEAEWEYAARAGSTTAYSFEGSSAELGGYAWYSGNSGSQSLAVAQKTANAWGLYDMHGNVWEWVADWYGNYPASEQRDPTGPNSGSSRVIRGGSWYSFARYCRSAYRYRDRPGYRFLNLGFRLVGTK